MSLKVNQSCVNAALQTTSEPHQNSPSSDLIDKIRAFSGSYIGDAMLTKISDFANQHMGAALPGKDTIKEEARLIKKYNGNTHAVTAVSKDGERIDGILIHATEVAQGAFSVVKKGLLITKAAENWQVTTIALHKGSKGEDYKNRLKEYANEGKTGVYLQEILLHKELFGDETHPHVENSPIYYGWLDNTRELMVHELRKGDVVDNPCRTSKELLRVARELASGLNFYHERDVLFRDIKPQNVLIDTQGRAILSDPFEVKEDQATTRAGSLAYLPWDFANGKTQTKACDLYGLGVTLLDIKYGYFAQVLNNIPDSSLCKEQLTCKEKLIKFVNGHFSHTDLLLQELDDRKIPADEQMTTLHAWNQARVINPVMHHHIIDSIAAFGGFKKENVHLVKLRMARLDYVISKLLATDPKERISAKLAAEKLK